MQTVLLINDSKFECIVLRDILFSLGFDTVVSDEYNALKLARNHNPDYVIVNYIMRDIKGDQLIALIKVQNPRVKCILSSSNRLSTDELNNKRVDAIFQTPVDKTKLVRIFDRIN